MLTQGVFYTILGIIIFQWQLIVKRRAGPRFNYPLIFEKIIPSLIINLLWIGLLGIGLYNFWQVHAKIAISIFGCYAILCAIVCYSGRYKTKARKLFRIYKKLKNYRSQEIEENILRETARLYYQTLGWGQSIIKSTLTSIFENKNYKVYDIKGLLSYIFIFEEIDNNFEFEDVIEWAFRKEFGDKGNGKKKEIF